MRETIKRNPLTSLCGIAVILASLGAFFFGKISWEQVFVGIPVGVGLLVARDGNRGSGPAALVLLLCFGLALPGCVTYKKCAERYGTPTDTIRVPVEIKVEVPVAVPVPPDSAETAALLDSLLRLVPGERHIVVSDSGRAEISYWRDQYARVLHIKAKCKGDTVYKTVTLIKTVEAKCPPQTVFNPKPEKKPWTARAWEAYCRFAGWLLLALLFVILIFLLLKSLTHRHVN